MCEDLPRDRGMVSPTATRVLYALCCGSTGAIGTTRTDAGRLAGDPREGLAVGWYFRRFVMQRSSSTKQVFLKSLKRDGFVAGWFG